MKSVFFVFCLISYSLLFGQIPEQKPLPKVVPTSPKAASLGKYGKIPTNLSTGRINKTIPLYEINIGKYNFPINLNYNYGGFMEEQDPSQVGLGWSISNMGSVSRSVYGKADDDDNGGYLHNYPTSSDETIGKIWLKPYYDHLWNGEDMTLYEKLELFELISNGNIDTQPDKFSINAFNLSGAFVFNWDKNPVLVAPFRPLKIEPLFPGTKRRFYYN